MNIQRMRMIFGLAAMAFGVALLPACGEHSSSPAATSTPLSALNGTVTGFGSVVVDGAEVEDAYARVTHENADGSVTNDVLQMGQRVRVSNDSAGRANQVLIDATLIGVVSVVNTSSLTVAGQVVLVNTDIAQGPVTVFGGGYTSLASVTVNDLVQVHGTPVYDAATSKYQIKATRIQKDSGTSRVQVNGKIAAYTTSATGATFTLNGLTITTTTAGTSVRPNGATLGNDVQVTVYGNSLSGSTLTATYIRVNRDQSSGNTTALAQLSGVVSNVNAAATRFELQGSMVNVGAATVVRPSGQVIANNAYVRVRGTVASDGSITATEIVVRTSDTTADLAKVLLIGVISDYVSDTSFMVRGVAVDASSAGLVKSNCPASFSAYSGVVRVWATQQSGTSVVLASRMECQPAIGTQVIRSLEGTVASVDTTAKTFSLTLSASNSRTVQWNDNTTFLGVSANAALASKEVHVDGYIDNLNVFVARVVRLDDNSANTPELDDKAYKNKPGSTGTGWTNYHNNHH